MESVSIFQGPYEIAAVIRKTPREAWRDAMKYVRELAHAEGVETEIGWERPAGRYSYARGSFRAVSTKKV